MPNPYFQFKQFMVRQEHCAMKVCTDACLFGAWVATRANARKVLDIGTGTGLLSLMLAQKMPETVFDAVEIDAQASRQAQENFEQSPWAGRLRVHEGPVQQFSASGYDFIISNPPFFSNDLKSEDRRRNLALHSEELSLDEMLAAIQRLLDPNGRFAILLPAHRATAFETLANAYRFYIKEKVMVKQSPRHTWFRVMYLLGRSPSEKTQSEIVIHSDLFNEYLKDYYLKL